MKFGSLFSGIGGFDLGLERAGMGCIWQVEKDRHCLSVLRRHYPITQRWFDVRRLTAPPAVDLICGGFPCQDLSVAGERRGLDGDRSGLWFEFRRVVSDLLPAWVLIENVPGLLSSNNGNDMAVILRGLAELGYWWSYRVLDSQYFGVAQRRRRVFIVGHLGGAGAAKVLFDSSSLQRNPQTSGEEGETPASSVTEDPDGDLEVVTARNSGKGFWMEDTLAGPQSARQHKGETQLISFDLGQLTHPENRANPQPGDPCHTIHSRSSHPPAIASGAAVRRLTPRECERLQGFPDDWTLVGDIADGPRWRMLGNAVTVNVAEWIGRRILGQS